MARRGVDGAEIDDGGVDGSTDGHDRHPRDQVRFTPLDVVIHDGAATVISGMVPSDSHGRLGAIQNADRTTRHTCRRKGGNGAGLFCLFIKP